jgi:excisionase family DNA binding protein
MIYPIFKTVETISKLVGIGENRIRDMINKNEVDYIECGNRKLLRLDSFDDWYARNKVPAFDLDEDA